jgi:hydrogenase 3 maturation protease
MVTNEMSKKCWLEALHQILAELETQGREPRLAIVGIGHELCGDDGLGVVVSQELETIFQNHGRIRVFTAGPAPENLCGVLRRFAPDLVVLIDAADIAQKPGEIRWLDLKKIDGVSASTHTLPLHILTDYLTAEIGCKVVLLGVQPAKLAYGPISKAVNVSIRAIVQGFRGLLSLEPFLSHQTHRSTPNR